MKEGKGFKWLLSTVLSAEFREMQNNAVLDIIADGCQGKYKEAVITSSLLSLGALAAGTILWASSSKVASSPFFTAALVLGMPPYLRQAYRVYTDTPLNKKISKRMQAVLNPSDRDSGFLPDISDTDPLRSYGYGGLLFPNVNASNTNPVSSVADRASLVNAHEDEVVNDSSEEEIPESPGLT